MTGREPPAGLAWALEAYRSGRVVVLARDRALAGGGCMLLGLPVLRLASLAFLCRHARGLISVLLPDRTQGGVQLLFDPWGAVPNTRLSLHVDWTRASALEGLAGVLGGLLEASAGASVASDLVQEHPFTALAAGACLSWPAGERWVTGMAHALGTSDAALLCTIFDEGGRILSGQALGRFMHEQDLPALYLDEAPLPMCSRRLPARS